MASRYDSPPQSQSQTSTPVTPVSPPARTTSALITTQNKNRDRDKRTTPPRQMTTDPIQAHNQRQTPTRQMTAESQSQTQMRPFPTSPSNSTPPKSERHALGL